jgi:hypothetical protein
MAMSSTVYCAEISAPWAYQAASRLTATEAEKMMRRFFTRSSGAQMSTVHSSTQFSGESPSPASRTRNGKKPMENSTQKEAFSSSGLAKSEPDLRADNITSR